MAGPTCTTTPVHRFMACGIAGLSVAVDSLSAVRHARVKVIRDATGLAVDYEVEGDYPAYGNNDDRADAIATDLVTSLHGQGGDSLPASRHPRAGSGADGAGARAVPGARPAGTVNAVGPIGPGPSARDRTGSAIGGFRQRETRSERNKEHPMADGEQPGPDNPIRVFLLDDHEVVRRGVHDLLDDEPDITVVGEAANVEQALVRVPALRPQVAVLDVRLPDGDGVTVCRELRSRMPELACLMLTSFDDEEALLDSIMAGASGYVLKQIQGSDLVSAVRTVAAGQSLLDPSATAKVMARLRQGQEPEPEPDALPGLTEREREILALIGEGLTNRQIGQRLYLAEKTVKNHISRLLAKLGVERRIQAAVIATQAQDRLKQDGH